MDYGDEFFFLHLSSCEYDMVCLATSKKIWVVLIVLVGIALEWWLMTLPVVSYVAECGGWWWWLGERGGDLRGSDIHACQIYATVSTVASVATRHL